MIKVGKDFASITWDWYKKIKKKKQYSWVRESLHSRDVDVLIRREAIQFGGEKNVLRNLKESKNGKEARVSYKKVQERKRLLKRGRN